jgi:uncharacterized membrane protein
VLPFQRRVIRNQARCGGRSRCETIWLPSTPARVGWLVTVATTLVLACADPALEPVEMRSAQGPSAAGAGGENASAEHPVAPASPAWCAVRDLLGAKCQRCHGAAPEHGAPFSLVTYEDTQVEDRKGRPRFEAIAAAVASDYMPPGFIELDPLVAPLTGDERSLLLDWCASGAPSGANAECAAGEGG